MQYNCNELDLHHFICRILIIMSKLREWPLCTQKIGKTFASQVADISIYLSIHCIYVFYVQRISISQRERERYISYFPSF